MQLKSSASTLLLVFASASMTYSQLAHAQTKKVPCYSGDSLLSYTSAQELADAKALAQAKTAAIIIEATQSIPCGDGSDGCFRPDYDAVAIIQKEVERSELWENLKEAVATH